MKLKIEKTIILLTLVFPLFLASCDDDGDGGGSGTDNGGPTPTFSFSGFIKDTNGGPITNVMVTLLELQTGVTHTAITGDQGFWLIGGIQDKGFKYTITPSLPGFVFVPQSYEATLGRTNLPNIKFTGVSSPTITVTSPQPGEIFRFGESVGITWITTGDIFFVDILHGNALGQYEFIGRSVPASAGQFNWTIPSSLNPGTYTIRVVSTNGLAVSETGGFVITTN